MYVISPGHLHPVTVFSQAADYRNCTPFQVADIIPPITFPGVGLDDGYGETPVFLTLLDRSLPMDPEPPEVRILRSISGKQPDGKHGCTQLLDFFEFMGFPCIVTRRYKDGFTDEVLFSHRIQVLAFGDIHRIATQLFQCVACKLLVPYTDSLPNTLWLADAMIELWQFFTTSTSFMARSSQNTFF